MEIKSISQKIFKPGAASKKFENSNQTNPFGISFKGKIINADVFETSETQKKNPFECISGLADAAGRGKLWASAAVSAAGQAMGKRLNTVVSFGRRMKEKVAGSWNYLNNTNLAISFDLVKRNENGLFNLTLSPAHSVSSLRKKPIGELREMFKDAVETKLEGAAV